MKNLIFILLLQVFFKTSAQDFINPYLDYVGNSVADFNLASSSLGLSFNYNNLDPTFNYLGEYEILLDFHPWGNSAWISGAPNNPIFDIENYSLSYEIELVSFPFTIDCAFPSQSDHDGGCNGLSTDRILTVPSDDIFDQSSEAYWEYTDYLSSVITGKLYNHSDQKEFLRGPNGFTISDQQRNDALVTVAFGNGSGAEIEHTLLPHSILKHTINIHCGATNKPIISSFSFLIDLTRGRMREYPFRGNNNSSVNEREHDILIRPAVFGSWAGTYNTTETANCLYNRINPIYNCGVNSGYEGCNINYTPFVPAQDDFCDQLIPNYPNAEYGDDFYDVPGNRTMKHIPLSNYSLSMSTCARNYDGTTLAGYTEFIFGQSNMSLFHQNAIVHQYYIDKNIKLTWINPLEKIIYNPSEVYITADNLKFPSNYTFKTIRGIYPFESEVEEAENDPNNGGPFTDPTKIDIPVKTDLTREFHVNSAYDLLGNDNKLSSLYHLQSGSKLTIEPCVKIFDATFEINPGSEIVFENWSTNQINVNRYQLLYSGGIVTKRNESFLFQNESETKRMLNYEGGDFIEAGENVDVNKPSGEYSVEAGAHVTFEAGNYVDLKSGFYAKSGSEFEASVKPVVIPTCLPLRLKNQQAIKSRGLSNSSEIGYFTVSPNPMNDNSFFMFEVFNKSNAQISIYDAMGNLIREVGEKSLLPAGKYSYNFHVNNLAAGLYFAKLQTNRSQKSIKFIKQ